mmetsp:Transcript_28870/g.83611  ORF Transcript_28870/g.83611 Transcript_28870/m.83611 type:complete len:103 (+) Transcript_28870:430-738(+)
MHPQRQPQALLQQKVQGPQLHVGLGQRQPPPQGKQIGQQHGLKHSKQGQHFHAQHLKVSKSFAFSGKKTLFITKMGLPCLSRAVVIRAIARASTGDSLSQPG